CPATLPTGSVHLRREVLRLLVVPGGDRKTSGLACPALDTAPAPDGRAPELAHWLREARAAHEHIHALRRNAEAFRDVDPDHELGARIDVHDETVALTTAVPSKRHGSGPTASQDSGPKDRDGELA